MGTDRHNGKIKIYESDKRGVAGERHKANMACRKTWQEFKMVNNYACNRSQPSLETLHKIAEILQVEVKELINSVEEKTDPEEE